MTVDAVELEVGDVIACVGELGQLTETTRVLERREAELMVALRFWDAIKRTELRWYPYDTQFVKVN